MTRRGRFRMSLARKVSWLFGAAVLLVIGVTLWSPWLQMNSLHHQTMFIESKRVAAAAFQTVDLSHPDWSTLELDLIRRWPGLVRALDLPPDPPHLVSVGPLPPSGFRHEAVQHFYDNPRQLFFWKLQREETLFRLAMAVRDRETEPHPNRLRGIIDVALPMPEDPSVWNSVVTILAGASGAVIAILVFYVVIQRLVLTPVLTLRRAAERVATGDMEARSLISTGDEFEKLSKTFNEMLIHLQKAQDEQRTINRSLDIKLGELAETNVSLFEANRLKSEFLANVTHELRTPLVSIIGFAELLRDAWESESPDRRRLARYSENIRTSGHNLLEVINDLLDIAKTEAGKMELYLSDFSIEHLCRDLIDFVQPLADKRDQQLSLKLVKELPSCHGDPGKVKQVLYNLLSNALKFTPPGGSITLGVSRSGDRMLCLVVEDTGPGIAPEDQEGVFEKFRQLDASATREHAGTGLGLTITKDLVLLLGGSIAVHSEVGKGAKFIVSLPIRSEYRESRRAISLT